LCTISTADNRGGTNDQSGLECGGSSGRQKIESQPVEIEPSIRDPARILLVSLDNVGDLVFASALAVALRERFPRAPLDVWCKAYTADIARLVPGVASVIASDPFWDRAPGGAKGKIIPFLRAMLEVRRTRYDLAVIASSQWRVAAAIALAGIPARVGRKRRRNHRWLTQVLPEEDRSRPVVADLGRLAAAVGAAPRAHYQLDGTPLATRKAFFAETLGPGPFVALHAFAGRRDRCVDVAQWRALGEALVRRDVSVIWIGSAAELAELRAGRESPRWYFADAIGDGSLFDSAALIALCDAFVGHDSGPLHVASALGVAVLGIFAPGEPQRTFPQGPSPARVIARPTPAGITAEVMLSELDHLWPLRRPTSARR
jgi:ADP-heptose:LPS heptosyltransferase